MKKLAIVLFVILAFTGTSQATCWHQSSGDIYDDQLDVMWQPDGSFVSTPHQSLTLRDNFDLQGNQWSYKYTPKTGKPWVYISGMTGRMYLKDAIPYKSDNRAVPIPAAILLFGSGLLGLGVIRRRFKK